MALGDVKNLQAEGKQYNYEDEDAAYDAAYVGADGGAKLFLCTQVDEILKLHTLSTSNDVSTASATATTFAMGGGWFQPNLEFGDNGGKLYELGNSGKLRQFTLSTPWDIGTAAQDKEIDFDVDVTGSFQRPEDGIAVSPDGMTMITANDGSHFQQFSMSTPFDIATLSFVTEVDLGGASYLNTTFQAADLAVDSAGASLIFVHQSGTLLHQVKMSTGWDLSTVSYTAGDVYDWSSEDSGSDLLARNVHIAADDSKVWLTFPRVTISQSTTVIEQYSVQPPPLRRAHGARIPLRVAAAHATYAPLRVAAAHAVSMPTRVARAHGAYAPMRVGRQHAARIAWGVRRAHGVTIELLTRLRRAHAAWVPLLLGTPVRRAHGARIPLRVAAAHGARVPLMAFVRRAHAAAVPLRTAVRRAHGVLAPLLAVNPVRRAHAAVFSLLGAPRTHVSMAATLSAGGRRLPMISWDIRAAEGGYLYEGQVVVSAEGYALVAVDEAVTLDLFGEVYELVVESKQRDRRGPAGRRFALGLRSPTVRFDFPRAEPVTRTFDEPVLARTAVEALLGEAVSEWDLVDWPIPAFRLAFEDSSPIAAAQEIVAAPGGTIQTDPDGTLRVRHLYPDSPKQRYADVTPARVVDDQSQVVAAGETFEPRRRVDRLVIRDTVEGLFRDRLEFEADEGNPRAGALRVYPSPWRTTLVVAHTSNAALQLTQMGETAREVEPEVVEFVAGKASTRYPVDALLEVEWLYLSLGAVTFEHYATELAAGGETGYSLARVRYQTRSLDYRLSSPTVDTAQLLLREVA